MRTMMEALRDVRLLEKRIDELLYELIDHRIETGRYQADEREQRFEELKGTLRRIEDAASK
jgi:hypothetical protein